MYFHILSFYQLLTVDLVHSLLLWSPPPTFFNKELLFELSLSGRLIKVSTSIVVLLPHPSSEFLSLSFLLSFLLLNSIKLWAALKSASLPDIVIVAFMKESAATTQQQF
jgi:hypothetical protein